MTAVAMPQLGESVAEGTVVRWLKRVGDPVAVDEPLFEVATDKANTEIPSLSAGVLREILVPEGTTVAVGTPLARIERAGDASAAPRAQLYSPVVRRLAREHHVDLAQLRGSGPGGRITRADMLAHVVAAATPSPVQGVPVAAGGRVAFTPLRAKIAENVAHSKRTVADVFSVIEADMENVHAVRSAHGLTYLPFIARATVDALRAFPAVNARLESDALVFNDAVHLGIAVDVDEVGLFVPVIRHAEGLNVTGFGHAIGELACAARAATLTAGDQRGSTFTITNNGAFGTLMTAPIVNPPNVAILSTDAVEQRVVAVDGMIAIRRRMYLCMSWDHRAFDGSTAAKFLARIKRDLEQRDWSGQL